MSGLFSLRCYFFSLVLFKFSFSKSRILLFLFASRKSFRLCSRTVTFEFLSVIIVSP